MFIIDYNSIIDFILREHKKCDLSSFICSFSYHLNQIKSNSNDMFINIFMRISDVSFIDVMNYLNIEDNVYLNDVVQYLINKKGLSVSDIIDNLAKSLDELNAQTHLGYKILKVFEEVCSDIFNDEIFRLGLLD